MSLEDKVLLVEAGLSQKEVGDLLGVSLQAVNKAIKLPKPYFTQERLEKLADLLMTSAPEKAEYLRNLNRDKMQEIREQDEINLIKSVNLNELLSRESGDFIWILNDPFAKIKEQIQTCRDLVFNTNRRLTILLYSHIDNVVDLLNYEIFNGHWQTETQGEIVLLRCPYLGITPEIIFFEQSVFVKTTIGFQSLEINEAKNLQDQLLKQSKMQVGFYPKQLGEGYQIILNYHRSSIKRLLSIMSYEIQKYGVIQQDTLEWLKEKENYISEAETIDSILTEVESQFGAKETYLINNWLKRI